METIIQVCIEKNGQHFNISRANVQFNDEYDAIIKNIVRNYPKTWAKMLKSKAFDGRYEDRTYLVDYIRQVTPLLSDDVHTFKTRVYWVLNHLTEFPWCKNTKCELHQMTKFNVKKLKDGYGQYCNSKCQHEAPSYYKGIGDAIEQRYGNGIRNSYQIEAVKNNLISRKDEIEAKKYQTRKNNNSFKASQPEDDVYLMLKSTYPNIIRQYKSPLYPWMCDFYIPSIDTYIEYNGNWTHNNHPFDPQSKEDMLELETWKKKAKSSKFFQNAIQNWTETDVYKRKYACENKLNYVELWSVDDAKKWLSEHIDNFSIVVEWNKPKAKYEFYYYSKYKPSANLQHLTNKNFIVKYFQQEVFYKKQKQMWRDDAVRQKLVENRKKYLNKEFNELTSLDILDGFKKSGLCYGYSHFNPNWFKWFIAKYGCRKCYDPTGGWGHRLLGSCDLDLYIYNDFSKRTKENVDRMIKYFKIPNAKTYCEDARSFIPTDEFDSMFTCPPYFNVEEYECGKFADMHDYQKFINGLFDVFYNSETCEIFGLVLREDFLGQHTNYYEKFLIPSKTNYFNSKSNKEFMYIFKK